MNDSDLVQIAQTALVASIVDHTRRSVVIDLMNIYGKVHPGGVIGGNDFSADIWQHT